MSSISAPSKRRKQRWGSGNELVGARRALPSDKKNHGGVTMENEATSISPAMVSPHFKRPHFSSLNHLSLPCRDLAETKRFYTDVLGGELIHDVEGFAEVRIADIIIAWPSSRAVGPVGTPSIRTTRLTPTAQIMT